MTQNTRKNFYKTFDDITGFETYSIMFNFGKQTINISKNSKIVLDYVHGCFNQAFSREGNDLVIGDDRYYIAVERLGIGYGKEEWNVSQDENNNYIIDIMKYNWRGNTTGYSETPDKITRWVMTEQEFADFQTQHNITVNTGKNTLYTTWPVLPNPTIHYHMNDCGDYLPANGKIILKNYFLYKNNNIFIGDKLISEILESLPNLDLTVKKAGVIYDSFLSETVKGSGSNDIIKSSAGNDTINAGKGNDKIFLGEGQKTAQFALGDGNDIIYDFNKADSVNLSLDTDNVFYTKSGNDLIINRTYIIRTPYSCNGLAEVSNSNKLTEKIQIKNYFLYNNKNTQISVSNGETVLTDDLTQELSNGTKHLKIVTDSKNIYGSDLSDEAFSTNKNEIFALGKGNDVIHFRPSDGLYVSPYSFGNDTVKLNQNSHVTLDFTSVGGDLLYEKSGNDAIITSRYKIPICGRDNGKEEWFIQKNSTNTYKITKTQYYFTGYGYKTNGNVTEEILTRSEYRAFQKENGIRLNLGKNTLYTSWAVVPNPQIHYSYEDTADYGMLLGSVTLKDYFKYNNDSVYIGDTSLKDILAGIDEFMAIDKSEANKGQKITDTLLNETITGSRFADNITSNFGDDTIRAGKGNDTILLGADNKTVYISKGDGKDIITVSKDNTSATIDFGDVKNISFQKSGMNLIVNRGYDSGTENTIIKGFYKNNTDDKVSISAGGLIIWNKDMGIGDITNIAWGVICGYPPCDPVPIQEPIYYSLYAVPDYGINEVMQEVSAWQPICNCPAFEEPSPQNNDEIPVFTTINQ